MLVAWAKRQKRRWWEELDFAYIMNVSQWDFLMVWIFTHDSEKVMGDIAKFVG